MVNRSKRDVMYMFIKVVCNVHTHTSIQYQLGTRAEREATAAA